MQVIIVNSQKGGSGKTMLCKHLSVEAERAGDGPVFVIDTDEAGVLAAWHHRREADKPGRADVPFEGLEKGLEMLAEIKRKLGVLLLSDVHESAQCARAGQVLDVLQIPAFLCRQTDLIIEAARTGKAVNVKKGQFVAPGDMAHSIRKVTENGNPNVFITERGTTFGYNNLIVDFRAIPMMQAMGYPVVFDATHSVQQPGGGGGFTSGQRQYVPTLAKAAIASGAQGLFMETHPNPDQAKSDAANQVPLAYARELISQCLRIRALTQQMEEISLPEFGKCAQAALTT